MAVTANNVVSINTFEVPEAEKQTFLRLWEQAHDVLIAQDGYLSSQLHQDTAPGTRARFIDVATWESEAAFKQALARPEVHSLLGPYGSETRRYQVVHADQHWDPQLAARRAAYLAA
ncbi:MAG TPA: antibiotic biosynthesis monooxygenase family protein [Candidatus Dormibacteraeota bacterium]|nr:antibiotic biosynthesis monooxygenase family protein [Candidatus Dormibacteraeota bacterium]